MKSVVFFMLLLGVDLIAVWGQIEEDSDLYVAPAQPSDGTELLLSSAPPLRLSSIWNKRQGDEDWNDVHRRVGGNQFRCDYQYFRSIDAWLKFNEMPADWNEARLRCHLEGGNLASPTTPDLRSAILQMVRQNKNHWATYTGIHATFSRGDFYSIEGISLGKINPTWAKNEPDNEKDKESCILILQDGTFADTSCDQTYPYICYKELEKTDFLNVCGTIDPEYILDQRTGSCYKFHRVPRTWSRGYMTCSAEGGYLAIINSETEAQVIREVFANNPAIVIEAPFSKDVAFVGFYDWTEHGEWLTIRGETLDQAGYAKFSPGEPNNGTPGQFCGAVYRTALFDDLWCESRYAFICEKDPNSLRCDYNY